MKLVCKVCGGEETKFVRCDTIEKRVCAKCGNDVFEVIF